MHVCIYSNWSPGSGKEACGVWLLMLSIRLQTSYGGAVHAPCMDMEFAMYANDFT